MSAHERRLLLYMDMGMCFCLLYLIKIFKMAAELYKGVLGESYPGGRYVEKETRWWTYQIQEATTAKKEAFKKWPQSKDDEDKEVYKVTEKECKKAVAIAKEDAYAELYKKLDPVEGNKITYKLAKTRNRRTKDICDNMFINDKKERFKQTQQRS